MSDERRRGLGGLGQRLALAARDAAEADTAIRAMLARAGHPEPAKAGLRAAIWALMVAGIEPPPPGR